MKKTISMRRAGPSVALILWALGIMAATGSAQNPVDWSAGDPVDQLQQRRAEQAPAAAVLEQFKVAETLSRIADVRTMRLRADYGMLAARAGARPADQTLSRNLQALDDRSLDLDAGLTELDDELRLLIARAPELAPVKDRVALLSNVLLSARDEMLLLGQEALVRRENFRRSGLSLEQSLFEKSLERAAVAAQRCLDSALRLKAAVSAAPPAEGS